MLQFAVGIYLSEVASVLKEGEDERCWHDACRGGVIAYPFPRFPLNP